MEERLSCNISLHEEEMDGKKVFVVECIDLGISDFGETVDEALENLRKAVYFYLEESPEKREVLIKQEPAMVTEYFSKI